MWGKPLQQKMVLALSNNNFPISEGSLKALLRKSAPAQQLVMEIQIQSHLSIRKEVK